MAKPNSIFVCQNCGANHRKWSGKCDDCGEWNSIAEESAPSKILKAHVADSQLAFRVLSDVIEDVPRISSNIGELDRVLGGGLVPGSAILIGGDPGIGKSTLLLQLIGALQSQGVNCAYVSGEESVDQVSLRAKRLNLSAAGIRLLSATNVNEILVALSKEKEVSLVVIDSIQTMFVNEFNSAPGTVSQVRASTHELIHLAKKDNIILLLVGHVTKDGQLAGPKVLEHMVDAVLYFEGEHSSHFRILRAVKNRFGGVNEIGVFEMRDIGLAEVTNPSELFLAARDKSISGSSVFAGIEGTRPLLIEVQALIAPSITVNPRRAVVGWDSSRLAMIIAVLAVRYGISLMDKEVYLNVVGGLKITEPAADLAMACALISAVTNMPLPTDSIIFGEIGLSGEIRAVSHIETRLKEANKLGFRSAIIPAGAKLSSNYGLELYEVTHIRQLRDIIK